MMVFLYLPNACCYIMETFMVEMSFFHDMYA